MKTLEEVGCGEMCTKVDRKGWEPGPWDDEPDRVDFRHAGFSCLLHRSRMGSWCGYVGVPLGHPAHGKGYDDVEVEVHGGLTYSDKCGGHVCHVPAPGEPDALWWFGFDCAHAWDLVPRSNALLKERPDLIIDDEVYRDLPYVRREVKRLAKQLREMAL